MGVRVGRVLLGAAVLLALGTLAHRWGAAPEVRLVAPARALAPVAAPAVRPPLPTPPAPERPEATPSVSAEPLPQEAPSSVRHKVEQVLVSLETLLDVGQEPPRERGLDFDANPHLRAAPLKYSKKTQRLHLEHHEDELGLATREIKRRRTEVELSLPVDESVELRGGLRVDRHERAGQDSSERDTTPTVGVEVRF